MNRPDRWNMAVWIVWALVYTPALGIASIAAYRQQGRFPAAAIVGFDPASPLKADDRPGLLRLQIVCSRPVLGLKVAVVASGGPGAAREGIDFAPLGSPLTLDPLREKTPLDLVILDADRRVDTPLRLALKAVGGVAIDPNSASWMVIIPRRTASGRTVAVSFAARAPEVTEGQRSLDLAVRFQPATSGPVTVSYQVDDRPAQAQIVPEGMVSATLPLDIPDDSVHTGDRILAVTLHNSPGVTLGSPATLKVLVHDDEPAPVVRVEEITSIVPSGSERPFAFRVTVRPPSARAVRLHCRVTSNSESLVDPPPIIEVAPGEGSREVVLKPTPGKPDAPTRSAELTFDRAEGGRLEPSPSRLTLSAREVKLKGDLLVVVVQTDELVENRDLDRPFWDVFEANRTVLSRGGFVLVRKDAPPAVWALDVKRSAPNESGKPFRREDGDSLDTILNAAFDAASSFRPRAANPNFQVAVLWPTLGRIAQYRFDPAALRWPPGNRAHFYVLGGSDFSDALQKVFQEKGGTARFLRTREQIEELADYIVQDLKSPTPR